MTNSSNGSEVPGSGPKSSDTPEKKRPPSPRNCREFIRRETANAMLDIVTTFVDKAKGGSVPHFTSLAKIGGLDQRSTAELSTRPRRRSLGRQLLDEVEKYEARQAAEIAQSSAQASAQAGGPASRQVNQIDNPTP